MPRYGSKRRFKQYREARTRSLASQVVNADAALEIMKGQEILVELLGSLESFIQEEVAISVKDGNIEALVISDIKKIEAFSKTVKGIKTAVEENIEVIAKAYSIS